MPTAPGFADISLPLANSALTRKAYITFGLDVSGTDPVAIADQAFAAFTASGSLAAQIDNGVTLGPAICHLGTDGTSDLVGIGTATATGGKALSSLPPNVAALFRKATTLGGRRGRGRFFIPWCVAQTDLDEGGKITSTTTRNALNSAASTFLTQLSTLPGPMVVLHSPGKTPVVTPSPVTSLVLDTIVGTQRRRLGRP